MKSRYLPFIAFLSGFLSLVYEIIWIREATLIFGATALSMSTVTGVFFTGLSLGSFWFGKKSQDEKEPLKLYGKIEVAIGIWVLLTPLMFYIFKISFPFVYNLFSNNILILEFMRILFVSIVIIVPTFLMGASLPLLLKVLVKDEKSVLPMVGGIAGINTVGAFTGVLAAGLYFIPNWGMSKTIYVCGIVNILLGLLIINIKINNVADIEDNEKIAEKSIKRSFLEKGLIISSVFIGFFSMANEIVWTRLYTILQDNTVYTYVMALSIVLAGLAVGYIFLGVVLKSIKNKLLMISVFLLIISFYNMYALLIPEEFVYKTVNGSVLGMFFFALITLWIPSFFAGMIFPLLVDLYNKTPKYTSSSTGMLYFANTLGGVGGAILTGFILLPLLGLQKSHYLVSAIPGIISVVIFYLWKKDVADYKGYYPFVLLIVFVAIIGKPIIIKESITEVYLNRRIEGKLLKIYETVSSILTVEIKKNNTILKIDGLWQGENQKNRQIMAAHIPMILSQGVKDVTVIGTGVGQTASRFLYYDIDKLNCIDIEGELKNVIMKYFPSEWLNDKRVNLITEDGRLYLSNSNKKTDLISIEIGQTFRPNLANFYSKEFYQDCYRVLSDSGYISQYVSLAAFDFDHFKRVIHTFLEVFPKAQLWYNDSEFLLIAGKKNPPEFSVSRFSKLMRSKELRIDLQYSYFGGSQQSLGNPYNFIAGFIAGEETLKSMAGDSKAFSDDMPELEYFSSKNKENTQYIDSLFNYLDEFPLKDIELDSLRNMSINTLRTMNLTDVIAKTLLSYYNRTKDVSLLEKAYSLNPYNYYVVLNLIYQSKRRNDIKSCIVYGKSALLLEPENLNFLNLVAQSYHKENELDSAIVYYKKVIDKDKKDYKTLNRIGTIYAERENYEFAEKYFKQAISVNNGYDDARVNLSSVLIKKEATLK